MDNQTKLFCMVFTYLLDSTIVVKRMDESFEPKSPVWVQK